MTEPLILRLNKAGQPTSWITPETAAVLACRGQILWALGEAAFTLRGGRCRATGERSHLDLPAILASDGAVHDQPFVPTLTNPVLFRRDQHLCLYCGRTFRPRELSRDHIIPRAQGGRDVWTNVVTACRRCNVTKANRRPEQAGMELLAVPFAPNTHEYFYLANRNILADQMAFLKSGFSKHMQNLSS